MVSIDMMYVVGDLRSGGDRLTEIQVEKDIGEETNENLRITAMLC